MTNRPPETNVNLFLPDWTFGIAMGKSEAPTVVSLFHLVKINANAQKTPPHTRIWEGNVARVPIEPFLAGCSNHQARLNKGHSFYSLKEINNVVASVTCCRDKCHHSAYYAEKCLCS